jgi:hypothetical protein
MLACEIDVSFNAKLFGTMLMKAMKKLEWVKNLSLNFKIKNIDKK